MKLKEYINKFLLPLNIFGAAIGLINLADDIVPAFVKLTDFLRLVLDRYEMVRDFIFYPLIIAIKYLFDVDIPDWVNSYLFLGLLFYTSFNFTANYKKEAFLQLIKIKNASWFSIFYVIIFLWPVYLFMIIEQSLKKKIERDHDKALLNWGINLIIIFFVAMLIVFLNWIWIRITLRTEAMV